MKKPHERVSKMLFDEWLRQTFTSQSISWSEPPEPNPDWFLYLNGIEYWVETTTIVPTVKHGRHIVLEHSLFASIHDFVDQVEAEAISEGILCGGYAIALGPLPGGRAFRDRISSAVIEYIRQTKALNVAKPLIIDDSGEYIFEVRKVSNSRNYLAEWIDLGARSNTEIDDDFAARLGDMIERKAERYANFSAPTILLLLDGFHIVDREKWLDYARKIDGIKQFEAVFRIKPANNPLLLYAKSDSWPGALVVTTSA